MIHHHFNIFVLFVEQLTQMAPHGTIIGQIQTAPTATPNGIPQVAATQLQQIQQGTQQTLALSVPQQVPLPPTIAPIKEEVATNTGTDSTTTTTATSTQSESQDDISKENGTDGKYFTNFLSVFISLQPDLKEHT